MLSARPVEGVWRRRRSIVNAVLICVLFAVPWIRIEGRSLILLDIPARHFHVFGLVIFPQELYFLWLLLAVMALSLFLFTALGGRLWCGWACPQTVFTDVFAAIARKIQGYRGHQAPRQIGFARLALTHAVWLAACGLIGFHLVGYFRSPYVVLAEIGAGDLSATTLWLLCFATLVTYVDFGFARQGFCKYLCPYARFQSVLFDRDTLVIGYDEARGEPRGKRTRSDAGDCVDCGLCVSVCPSEIDIRHGLQLECIACTQCIDACDGVMKKLDRPPNLIGYRALSELESGRPPRLLRTRTVAYAGLLVVSIAAFVGLLVVREPLDLQVLRNPTQLFQRSGDGRATNAFTLHIENRSLDAREFELLLEPHEEFDLIAGQNPVSVPAANGIEARVFVLARPGVEVGASGREIAFTLQSTDGVTRVVRESLFLAGGRS